MEIRIIRVTREVNIPCDLQRSGVMHEPHVYKTTSGAIVFCPGLGGTIAVGGDVYAGLSIRVDTDSSTSAVAVYKVTYTAYLMPPPDRIKPYLERLGCTIEDAGESYIVRNLPKNEAFAKFTDPVVVQKQDLYFTFISSVTKAFGEFGSRALFLSGHKDAAAGENLFTSLLGGEKT
jgi:uncharacterized protein (DUF1330 family)